MNEQCCIPGDTHSGRVEETSDKPRSGRRYWSKCPTLGLHVSLHYLLCVRGHSHADCPQSATNSVSLEGDRPLHGGREGADGGGEGTAGRRQGRCERGSKMPEVGRSSGWFALFSLFTHVPIHGSGPCLSSFARIGMASQAERVTGGS